MMCANELATLRNESVLKWEKEKAKSLARLAEASIEFCEKEIGLSLEKVALNPRGGVITVSLSLAVTYDNYNNKVLCPICADNKKYADGTISRKADTSVSYSQAIIERYLQSHCLTVEWVKDAFYRYGWGSQPAVKLIVSVEQLKKGLTNVSPCAILKVQKERR